MSGNEDEKSIEDIHREILTLRDSLQPTRRDVMIGGAALLAGGALVATSGTAAADDGSESGNIASAANPALNVYTDKFHFHERTSDPGSPSDGTMWYNSTA